MTEQLGDQRAARRETMLQELIAAMRRHHRRRRLRRTAAAWGLLLAVAGTAWIVRAQQPAQPPGPGDTELADGRQVEPTIRIIRQSPRTGLVTVIDDDELVLRLAEIDRPAGLIRCEGRTWLTRAVADAEIAPAEDPVPPL
jgi:hypothetical protein